MAEHLIDGEFQSDKYPTTPRGKVPLSTKDAAAQDLLWEYAQRRRSVDAEFSADLELILRKHGFDPSIPFPRSLTSQVATWNLIIATLKEVDEAWAASPINVTGHGAERLIAALAKCEEAVQGLSDGGAGP